MFLFYTGMFLFLKDDGNSGRDSGGDRGRGDQENEQDQPQVIMSPMIHGALELQNILEQDINQM